MQAPGKAKEGRNGKRPVLYRLLKELVMLFSPKYTLHGTENLPDEPCVIVANHCQMYGPIAAVLYMPRPRYTWCMGEMMRREEVPAYAFQDFWSMKPRWTHWFYRLLSHLIAPLAEYVFTNARTIPVYHDVRIVSTFRQSLERLAAVRISSFFRNARSLITRSCGNFRKTLWILAQLCYRRTGNTLRFVPAYIAPSLKSISFGEPVSFCPHAPIDEERERISGAMMEAITRWPSICPSTP